MTVLADTGYANGTTVQKLQGQGLEVLATLERQIENGHKHHDFGPVPTEMEVKTPCSEMEETLGAGHEEGSGIRERS